MAFPDVLAYLPIFMCQGRRGKNPQVTPLKRPYLLYVLVSVFQRRDILQAKKLILVPKHTHIREVNGWFKAINGT